MFDPALKQILTTAFTWAVCGSLVAAVARFFNRTNPGPRIDQAAAIGFLVGAAFGAAFGIFQSFMLR